MLQRFGPGVNGRLHLWQTAKKENKNLRYHTGRKCDLIWTFGCCRFIYLRCRQSAVSQSRPSRSSHPRLLRSSSGSRSPTRRQISGFSSAGFALKSGSTGNKLPRPAPRLSAGCTIWGFLPGKPQQLRRRFPCWCPRCSTRRTNSAPRRRSPVALPFLTSRST